MLNPFTHEYISYWHAATRLLIPALIVLTAFAPTAHAGEVVTYVYTNHLGSPVIEAGPDGAILKQESYRPYGEATGSPGDETIGYTGHRQDGGTGLVYMQARYYDPVIGRFLSTDPVTFSPDKPNHFNRYWYANGNPYGFTDPDGRIPLGLLYAPSKEFQKKMAARSLAATSVVTSAAAMYAPKTTVPTAAASVALSTISITSGFVAGQLSGASLEFSTSSAGTDVALEALGSVPHPAAKAVSGVGTIMKTGVEAGDLSLDLFQDVACDSGSSCPETSNLSSTIDKAIFGQDAQSHERPSVADELNEIQNNNEAIDMD